MKENRIKRLKKILLLSLCVVLASSGPAAVRIPVLADEPASAAATLSAGDDFFDAGTRTLTVDFAAPAGTSADLIAVAYNKDGSIKETVFRSIDGPGDAALKFNKTALSFRIFAVDPDTLAPIARDLSKTREYTADDMDDIEGSLNLPELSDDAAKALGAMAADYLKTMDAVNSILSITREKTTVSRNVSVSGNGSNEGETVLSENTVVSENGSEITYSVISLNGTAGPGDYNEKTIEYEDTRFEAIYDNKDALDHALSLVDAADAANSRLEDSAAVLSYLAKDGRTASLRITEDSLDNSRAARLASGLDESGYYEKMAVLAEQAGLDMMQTKRALSEIRSLIESKFDVETLSSDSLEGYCASVSENTKITFGAGAEELMDAALLMEGADLAVNVGEEGSVLILVPGSGKTVKKAGDTVSLNGAVFVYSNPGTSPKAGFIGDLSKDTDTAFDRYVISQNTGALTAGVTELFREDMSEDEITKAAKSRYDISQMGEDITFEQAKEAFILKNSFSDPELDTLAGGYLGTVRNTFFLDTEEKYNSAMGYRLYDRTEYWSGVGEYVRERYTLDRNRDKVGYYERWVDDRKMNESFYSSDRRTGLNGLVYEKAWYKETGILSQEIHYTSGKPSSLTDPEGNSGNEEPAGEIPHTDGSLFRTTKNYYTDGSLKSLYVEQWRQDFFEEYCRRNGTDEYDFAAESAGWFQLLYRYYLEDGTMQSEDMVLLAPDRNDYQLRRRVFNDKGERKEEYRYDWKDEQLYFNAAHHELYAWYTTDDLEDGRLNGWPGQILTQMPGRLYCNHGGAYGEDTYFPAVWYLEWTDGPDPQPIPNTVQKDGYGKPFYKYYYSSVQDPETLNWHYPYPEQYDVVGWIKLSGGTGSDNQRMHFIPVEVHPVPRNQN